MKTIDILLQDVRIYDIVRRNFVRLVRGYLWCSGGVALLFNSYSFILAFLPITLVGYFFIANFAGKLSYEMAKTAASMWMVVMSLMFYSYWDINNLPILLGSIIFNYFIGYFLTNKPKKIVLCSGILVNLGLLIYYKYINFFLDNISIFTGFEYTICNIVLPLGISFFTFTQIAFLVDVYKGETKNYNFVTYCEFVTIFPHLIAGPILDHKKMLPQFIDKANYVVNYENISLGLVLFSIGLFKKVVIADQLSPWVADVFTCTSALTFLEAWAGALSYTYQLYFDFSAYSEMAVGLGMMFNFSIPINFNSPYQARSVIDFWHRWHISLGNWVRSYIYIPLGGNRLGSIRKMVNLFCSMLIIGLWHGAGWTFVAWGGIHGVLLIINHLWRKTNIVMPKIINWGMTFIAVMVCWVFFRAESFSVAIKMICAMTDIGSFSVIADDWQLSDSMSKVFIWLAVLTLIVLFMKNPIVLVRNFKPNNKWLLLVVVMLFYSIMRITLFSEFLYFQF